MYKTEQENFWYGEFGDEYVIRNNSKSLLSSNIALFSKILSRISHINTVIEFGANIGLNLKAMDKLIPDLKCTAVEINKAAAKILRNDKDFQNSVVIHEQSILDYKSENKYDLSLIKGVLIHINPEELNTVYKALYESSDRYICIAEYYNPTPVMIKYRNNENKLFKRDFAGEFMEKYPDVDLIDYGFAYHRDNNFKQDDITWFLLEKK